MLETLKYKLQGYLLTAIFAACGCASADAYEERAAAVTSPTVSTDLTAYVPGQPITISWAGLPGNATDWIAYAPAGSADTTVTRWMYTGGAGAGSATLEGTPAAGAYVARAFVNGSYAKLAESAAVAVGSVPPAVITMSVPLFAPTNALTLPARSLSTVNVGGTTIGITAQLSTVPVGATIVGVSARVRDNVIASTTLTLSMAEQSDLDVVDHGTSSPSAGDGTFQTLTLSGLTVVVRPLHSYYAGVFVSNGNSTSIVTALDVSYTN